MLATYVEREGTPPDEHADARRRIRAELEGLGGDGHQVYVAEVAAEVVAYARVRRLDHDTRGLPEALPEGWYLTGVVVRPAFRRRGLGRLLTEARIAWVRDLAQAVHYVTNKRNSVSIALHDAFGFEAVDVDFAYPRAGLEYGEGALYTLPFGG